MNLKKFFSGLILGTAVAVSPAHAAPILSDIVFVDWHGPGQCPVRVGRVWKRLSRSKVDYGLHRCHKFLNRGARAGN